MHNPEISCEGKNAKTTPSPSAYLVFVSIILLITLTAISHFYPMGIAHYNYAPMGWAVTRDRSEVIVINGTLSIKYSHVNGLPADPSVQGHFAFVGGYRSLFHPPGKPVERPWTIALVSHLTPLYHASLRQLFVVVPLWPVIVIGIALAVWRGQLIKRKERNP